MTALPAPWRPEVTAPIYARARKELRAERRRAIGLNRRAKAQGIAHAMTAVGFCRERPVAGKERAGCDPGSSMTPNSQKEVS